MNFQFPLLAACAALTLATPAMADAVGLAWGYNPQSRLMSFTVGKAPDPNTAVMVAVGLCNQDGLKGCAGVHAFTRGCYVYVAAAKDGNPVLFRGKNRAEATLSAQVGGADLSKALVFTDTLCAEQNARLP